MDVSSFFSADLQPPPPSLAIREEEFCAWVGEAASGQRLEYHRGHLVIDRCRGFSPLGEKLRRELDAIADRAYALAEAGQLLLVQERHGDGDYSYFAIKPKRQPRGTPTARDRGGK